MSFLAPAAFLLAVLLPVIIAMYLLKLRRTEQVVSSTYLWRQMVRDVEANAPWQRLRRNLLLILQLLFMAALIFALTRPFSYASGSASKAAILILDTSASMFATDILPNRIEAAKSQALRLVQDMPEGARLTVIAAGDQPKIMVSSSADLKQVNQAIENVQAVSGGSNLGLALQLASAIAARQPDTEIIILSDGRATLPERAAIQGSLRYLPIGTRDENQAVSLLTLQPVPGGQSSTAFAQVVNYSQEAVNRRIAFYGDGQLLNAFDIQILAGSEKAVLAEGIPLSTKIVEARLLRDNQTVDYLQEDDHIFAVQRPSRPVKVSLVSQGNLFLQTALSLLPGIDTTLVDPASASSYPSADLTVFDGYVPITTTLPQGALLFIAPPRSTEYFTVTGVLQSHTLAPASTSQAGVDPLLENLSLDEVNVLDAVRIPLPAAAHPVITTGPLPDSASAPAAAFPLLFTQEAGGRRLAVLAFDLRRSDLPLQVAFPVLIANLTHWLAPSSGGDVPTQMPPFTPVTFSVPPDIPQTASPSLLVTKPDGSTARLAPSGGQVVFASTGQTGVYQASWNGAAPLQFAVNLASPQESNIQPVGDLSITGISNAGAGSLSQLARREWWRLAAALALVVLMVEWLVYNRSALAVIRKRLGSARSKPRTGRPSTRSGAGYRGRAS